jgi:uncharacterized protein
MSGQEPAEGTGFAAGAPGEGRAGSVHALGPVQAGERIASIDVLRGLALLGILVMNINAFALPGAAYANPFVAGGAAGADLWAWRVSHLFFDFKMVTIFSMLFGAGLVLMSDRATARGGEVKGVYLRRNLWLLAIGAAHGYLLWFGDILFHYALGGLILYLFRRQPVRRLLAAAAVLILINVPLFHWFGSVALETKRTAEAAEAKLASGSRMDDLKQEERDAIEEWGDMRPEMAPTPEDVRREIEIHRGGYWGILVNRAPDTFMMQTLYFLLFGLWRTTGAMLLGMALMKMGVFSARLPARLYNLCIVVGYGAGLPLVWIGARGLIAHRFELEYAVGGVGSFNYFGSLLVAVAHVGVVMRLCQSGALARLRRRLAAVGQMALTNYLLHSLICTTLFYGYGLGLFASLPRARLQGVVAAIAVVQLVVSPLWLARFRFGPAEWVWRSLTYGRRQPLRAARAAEGLAA